MDRGDYLSELMRRKQKQGSTARTIAITFGVVGGLAVAILFAVAASRGRSGEQSRTDSQGPATRCLGHFRGDGEMLTEPFAIFASSWLVDWETWAGELGGAEASGVFNVYLMVPGEGEGRPIVSSVGPGKNRCTLAGPGNFQMRVVANQPWSLAIYDRR